MKNKAVLSLLVFLGLTMFFLPDTVLADNNARQTAFMKRYLTVTPPKGWTAELPDNGMFKNCAGYADEDRMIAVTACPTETSASFGYGPANVELNNGASRLGKCIIIKDDDLVALFVPLKNANEGAVFFIFKHRMTTTNANILRKAQPMLKSFAEFDMPEELLHP